MSSVCRSLPSISISSLLQLGADDHSNLSLEGADGGGSASGNGCGGAPTAPAGGSRSSSRNLGASGGEKEEGKKVRRQWESWSTEDKNTFFEGLYEVSVHANGSCSRRLCPMV